MEVTDTLKCDYSSKSSLHCTNHHYLMHTLCIKLCLQNETQVEFNQQVDKTNHELFFSYVINVQCTTSSVLVQIVRIDHVLSCTLSLTQERVCMSNAVNAVSNVRIYHRHENDDEM